MNRERLMDVFEVLFMPYTWAARRRTDPRLSAFDERLRAFCQRTDEIRIESRCPPLDRGEDHPRIEELRGAALLQILVVLGICYGSVMSAGPCCTQQPEVRAVSGSHAAHESVSALLAYVRSTESR